MSRDREGLLPVLLDAGGAQARQTMLIDGKLPGQEFVDRQRVAAAGCLEGEQAAAHGGLLSLEEACSRYTLTVDEFLSWQFSIDQHGLAGLRTTRIQQYRQ